MQAAGMQACRHAEGGANDKRVKGIEGIPVIRSAVSENEASKSPQEASSRDRSQRSIQTNVCLRTNEGTQKKKEAATLR